MDSLRLLTILGLTSVVGYVLARRHGRLRPSELRGAILDVVDYIGLTVVFVICNFALGLALLLGYRALTGRFVSVYVLNDATIVIVSFLQALVIRRWRERCK